MIKLPSFKRTNTRLGVVQQTRDYDLPFHDDRANRFLTLLIGLMTYLALLSAAAGMVLTGMADRWTTGLANHMTVELPAMDANGTRLTDAAQKDRLTRTLTVIGRDIAEDNITVQSAQEVGKLVEPWLTGGDKVLGQIPLPTLISITSDGKDPTLPDRLRKNLAEIAPDIQVDTHQSWLNDVLRLTGTLSFAAYLIGFITTITTISAVGGAVRARMAAYQEQLEILHLIGAADEYITRQFQRHALQMSLAGAGAGFMLSMLTLLVIDQLAGAVQLTLIPSLMLSQGSFIFLIGIPILTCVLTVFTTRLTVIQTLQDMP